VSAGLQPSIAPSDGQTRAPVILQVLPALDSGGVERGTVDIAAAIARQGWTALVASRGGPMVREVLRAGATHLTLPLKTRNPLWFRRNSNLLVNLMRDHGVDLVHVRSRAPAWSAVHAARIVGVPLVTTFHGAYSHGSAIKRRYSSVMLRGARVIAVSEFIAAHIRETYPRFDTSRMLTIPRGVDFETFDPAAVSGPRIVQLSKAWRLADGVRVILMPGRFTRLKGHATVIDALARMSNTDNLCVIFGADEGRERYRRELETLVRDLGLASRVRFAGRQADMPAAYMLADVVVSASTVPEAFGRVSAEAQAMGRPVVATAHGASGEIVIPGDTGWLVPPGDATALAGALDEILTLDSWKRELLAARARRHIAANFRVEGMCDATLAAYRELLQGVAATA
jgi:glycosyltransferase involved in cell wall biosynthesis